MCLCDYCKKTDAARLLPEHSETPPNIYTNLCVGNWTIFQKAAYSHNHLFMFVKVQSTYTFWKPPSHIINMLLETVPPDSEEAIPAGLGSWMLEPSQQHNDQFLLCQWSLCPDLLSQQNHSEDTFWRIGINVNCSLKQAATVTWQHTSSFLAAVITGITRDLPTQKSMLGGMRSSWKKSTLVFFHLLCCTVGSTTPTLELSYQKEFLNRYQTRINLVFFIKTPWEADTTANTLWIWCLAPVTPYFGG